MSFPAGVQIGPYEILSLLGSGGMGEVFKARDSRLHRIIAFETLPAEKVADAGCKRRFLLEAQATSRLNHPNTVTIWTSLKSKMFASLRWSMLRGLPWIWRITAACP
jgi:eukaryotic-like serine/threonine-protein kinase